MKAALIDNQNNVNNVIVWDDTCTAPKGTVVVVVADDVAVAPGWTLRQWHLHRTRTRAKARPGNPCQCLPLSRS
jgi:hypothetical protein